MEIDHLRNVGDIIKNTEDVPAIKLCEILPDSYVKKHLLIVKLLNKLNSPEELVSDEVKQLETSIGIKIDKINEILSSDIEKQAPEEIGRAHV